MGQDQEDLLCMLHVLSMMHAVHRQGPEHYWELGALISQAYKAAEQAAKDRDWTLGWLWTGLPDPRPNRRLGRGLAHPSEHSAGLAHLRELQTLEQHRQLLAGKGDGKGGGGGGYNGGGVGRAPQGQQHAAQPGGGQEGRGKGGRGGKGKGGRGGKGGGHGRGGGHHGGAEAPADAGGAEAEA